MKGSIVWKDHLNSRIHKKIKKFKTRDDNDY